MAKFEKEVKILDIDVDEMRSSLINIGAKEKGKKDQKIYVYDIPTIYYRYLEIRELLKSNNPVIVSANIKRLEILIKEAKDLLNENDSKLINDILDKDILEQIKILEDKNVEDIFKKLKINPNKWIRLRKSNDISAITSKHILEKERSNFEQVLEVEFEVSSFEEANLFLESIGLARRSYQEKIRYSYIYKNAEIEIDIWPIINPYMEIECDDEEVIKEIINKLNLNKKEIVSMNTEQIYNRIGINVHEISELRFDK